MGKSSLASVVVADTGYKLDISHDKLVACSEDDLKMPFLVSRIVIVMNPCSAFEGPAILMPEVLYITSCNTRQ